MTAQKSANPAAGLADGARSSELVAAALRLEATSTIANIQVPGRSTARDLSGRGFRTRLIRAHWVVVQQNDGQRRSIPVFIRRPVPIARSGGGRCRLT
jgi:hypothetical protein